MNSSQNIAIEAATDGACSGNPGKGGWGGLILFSDGSEIEIGGSEENTTNNRMELTAAIKTLEKLAKFKLKNNFKLRTDSKYLIEGYTKWIINWKKNGWKTSSGKSVMNVDLWRKIDQLRFNDLKMEFVKGHSGDEYNERVDLIATNYCKGIPIQSKKEVIRKDLDKKNVSQNLQKLFSQFELVNEFAQKGYLLKSHELYDLLKLEKNISIENHNEFEWRNWIVKPTQKKYWRIISKEK